MTSHILHEEGRNSKERLSLWIHNKTPLLFLDVAQISFYEANHVSKEG